VHVPAATKLATKPFQVHTDGVKEVITTASPEVAVAVAV
jgi:hypothetical protein